MKIIKGEDLKELIENNILVPKEEDIKNIMSADYEPFNKDYIPDSLYFDLTKHSNWIKPSTLSNYEKTHKKIIEVFESLEDVLSMKEKMSFIFTYGRGIVALDYNINFFLWLEGIIKFAPDNTLDEPPKKLITSISEKLNSYQYNVRKELEFLSKFKIELVKKSFYEVLEYSEDLGSTNFAYEVLKKYNLLKEEDKDLFTERSGTVAVFEKTLKLSHSYLRNKSQNNNLLKESSVVFLTEVSNIKFKSSYMSPNEDDKLILYIRSYVEDEPEKIQQYMQDLVTYFFSENHSKHDNLTFFTDTDNLYSEEVTDDFIREFEAYSLYQKIDNKLIQKPSKSIKRKV